MYVYSDRILNNGVYEESLLPFFKNRKKKIYIVISTVVSTVFSAIRKNKDLKFSHFENEANHFCFNCLFYICVMF